MKNYFSKLFRTGFLTMITICGVLSVNFPALAALTVNPDTVTTYLGYRVVVDPLRNDVSSTNAKIKLGSVASPAHGTVGYSELPNKPLKTPLGGYYAFVYQPSGTFTGVDSFTYSATDGSNVGSAKIYITVLSGKPIPPDPRPAALGSEGMNILFLGDGSIENQNLTNGVALEMERRFGYYGTGFRSFVSVPDGRTNNAFNYGGNGWDEDIVSKYAKITTAPDATKWIQRHWGATGISVNGTEVDVPSVNSPSGHDIKSIASGASVTVEFYGVKMIVYYATDPSGGSFQVKIGDSLAATVNTAENAAPATTASWQESFQEIRKIEVSGLTRGWHTITIIATSSSPVTLTGWDARNYDGTGPVALCNNWGLGGEQSTSFRSAKIYPRIFKSAAKLINPDKAFLMYGTNDHNITKTTSAALCGELGRMVIWLRGTIPNIKVCLASCPAMMTPPAYNSWSGTLQASYNRDLPGTAKGMGGIYFNTFAEMGGDHGSRGEYVNSYYWNLESLSPEGGAYVGRKAFNALYNMDLPAPEVLRVVPDIGGTRPVATTLDGIGSINFWLDATGTMIVDADNGVKEISDLNVWWQFPDRAIQNSKGRRPKLVQNVLNGRPGLYFDGDSSCLSYPKKTVSGSVLAVLKAERADDPLLKSWEAMTFLNSGGNLIVYINMLSPSPLNEFKVSYYSNYHHDVQSIGCDQFVTDKATPPYHEYYFKGYLCELMTFNQYPTTAQLQTAINYLNNKWFNPANVAVHPVVASKLKQARIVRIYSVNGRYIGTASEHTIGGLLQKAKLPASGVYVKIMEPLHGNAQSKVQRVVQLP